MPLTVDQLFEIRWLDISYETRRHSLIPLYMFDQPEGLVISNCWLPQQRRALHLALSSCDTMQQALELQCTLVRVGPAELQVDILITWVKRNGPVVCPGYHQWYRRVSMAEK